MALKNNLAFQIATISIAWILIFVTFIVSKSEEIPFIYNNF